MTKEIMWHGILEDLLIKGYKVEAVGEYVFANQAVLDQKTLNFQEYSDEILTIIEDSKNHKKELERLFENIDLPLIQNLYKNRENLYKNYFSKVEISLEEVVLNLIINENLMTDIYEEIDRKMNIKLVSKIWKQDKGEDQFFSILKSLKKSENKHQDIIKQLLNNKQFLNELGIIKVEEPTLAMDEINKARKVLSKDLSFGIREVIFFESNQEVFDHILDKISSQDDVFLRTENTVEGRKVFEIEIRGS